MYSSSSSCWEISCSVSLVVGGKSDVQTQVVA